MARFPSMPSCEREHQLASRPAYSGASPRSKGRLEARKESARSRRTEGTRIGEWRTAIGEVRNRPRIKECSVSRVSIIEHVVGTRIDLKGLVELIGCMQVENRVRR